MPYMTSPNETLDAGHVPVAVIAPTTGIGQHFPDAELLHDSEEGFQHLDSVTGS